MDYEGILKRHKTLLTQLARVSNCGISVFDVRLGRHVFTSFNFQSLFGYDLEQVDKFDTEYIDSLIHPDDLPALERNGRAAEAMFRDPERKAQQAHTKLISEYRMRGADGGYIRVIEQFQVLEFDADGEVWLSLSVLDASPGQTPFAGVQSKLKNCSTGEVYQIPEFSGAPPATLSDREKDILRLVRDGLLSKEISDQLAISVHTVNTHRQRILEKLGADNSMEAVRYASKYGLLD